MRNRSVPRALWLLVVATSAASCGFDAHPKSGTVACKPGGSGCCPEGYLCVGRGTSTGTGSSAGTCWNKKDLPPAALSATHDYTPTIPNDPACMVTDWLPPGADGGGGRLDGGAIEAGNATEAGRVDLGGAEGRPDSGLDAAWVQDTASGVPMDVSGTDGADGSGRAEAPAADGGDAGTDSAGGTDSRPRYDGGLDSGAIDASIVDAADGSPDVALEMPALSLDAAYDLSTPLIDATLDTAGSEVSGTLDSSIDLAPGDEAGSVDAETDTD
jgi:hypothetical protein